MRRRPGRFLSRPDGGGTAAGADETFNLVLSITDITFATGGTTKTLTVADPGATISDPSGTATILNDLHLWTRPWCCRSA